MLLSQRQNAHNALEVDAKLSTNLSMTGGDLMSAKRALVVDDSKSARAFLARILERHEIAVDAADSAEAAIEYLTRNKPDVIFMDHMMPGMDGFQAVQSIKNNPRTSTIPILMYTSQEGDLYLGQARALGAEGVLPKQIKQADVTRMLYQLRLVNDRRGGEQTTFDAHGRGRRTCCRPTNPPSWSPQAAATATDAATGPAAIGGADVAQAAAADVARNPRRRSMARCRRSSAALRSFIAATLDSQAERLQGDLADLAARRAARPKPTCRHWCRSVAPGRPSPAGRWPASALAGASLMSWVVVAAGRRGRRAAHRPGGGLCRSRNAARPSRGS